MSILHAPQMQETPCGGGVSFLAFLVGCVHSRRRDRTEGGHSTAHFTSTEAMFLDRQRCSKTCLPGADGEQFLDTPHVQSLPNHPDWGPHQGRASSE